MAQGEMVMKVGMLAAIVVVALCWWFFRSKSPKWIVYYGSQITVDQLRSIDLAILDPDTMIPVDLEFRDQLPKTQFIAYLSLGEVNEQRYYWHDVSTQPLVIEPNPDWPGAHRVDIRSEVWQRLILDDVIPSIVSKGYHGLFFDTIDTAIYLEAKDPERFAGSKLAMIKFVRAIHDRYPALLLYPNNGFEMLRHYSDIIAGVVVEDLYTRYQFDYQHRGKDAKPYIKTPIASTRLKEQLLDAAGQPVYTILYDASADTDLIRYGITSAKAKGYHWYRATIDLLTVGDTN